MNVKHEQYKCVPGSSKYFFYVNSNSLDEDIKWIIENEIDSVRLSQYDGYSIKSIEPILKLKQIKSLAIFLTGVDLERIAELNGIEELVIGESSTNINLMGLSRLKEFYLVYQNNIRGLSSLQSLEKLIVVKANNSFFVENIFKYWRSLSSLTLLSPKLPTDLLFLKDNSNLAELEIFNSKSIFNLRDLSFIHSSLEILKIGNCKYIQGIEGVLQTLTNLRWIQLTDSVLLKDTKFIEFLPRLETLIVLGTSYFKNGDILNLNRKIKCVRIDNKRHYNLKQSDFNH